MADASSGQGRDQYPSIAWARKMPTLIIPKTAVIVSSIALIPLPSDCQKNQNALHSQKDSKNASDSLRR
jgi:hypothetical protein